MCMCVCACVCVYRLREKDRKRRKISISWSWKDMTWLSNNDRAWNKKKLQYTLNASTKVSTSGVSISQAVARFDYTTDRIPDWKQNVCGYAYYRQKLFDQMWKYSVYIYIFFIIISKQANGTIYNKRVPVTL